MRDDLQSLETQREVLKRELAELEDMRQGSLRRALPKMWEADLPMRQSGCRVGHGPSWSLTRAVKGKTRTKIIPSQAGGNHAQAAKARQDVSGTVSAAPGSEREDLRRETG